MVTRLDRLARSVADLITIIGRIKTRHASLRILAINLDTETATGKLMISILGSVAEFERDIMLERQREGIAKAKAAGKYKGRAPTALQKADQVMELISQGWKQAEVAEELGVSRSSVQRIVKAAPQSTAPRPCSNSPLAPTASTSKPNLPVGNRH